MEMTRTKMKCDGAARAGIWQKAVMTLEPVQMRGEEEEEEED